MDAIIKQIAKIEETAESIVDHAQQQKFEVEQEIQKRRDEFDSELDAKVNGELDAIRTEGKEKMDRVLSLEHEKHRDMIDGLEEEFAAHHTEYAKEILKQILEV